MAFNDFPPTYEDLMNKGAHNDKFSSVLTR